MSSLITLSSSLLRQVDATVDPSDFTVSFRPPIELGSLNYEVALLKTNLWFTRINIEGKSIFWSSDGTTYSEMTIPDGNYTIGDVNQLLRDAQEDAGVTDTVDGLTVYGIELEANYNTNRSTFIIDNTIASGAYTFKIDLTQAGNLSTFLGFDEQVITATASGENIAQVNGGDDAYQVRCDLIDNSYDNGSASDIVYSFVPSVPPGANIEINPIHLVYLQVNKSTIYSMRMRLTNQDGTKIDLNGEDIVYSIILRQLQSTE